MAKDSTDISTLRLQPYECKHEPWSRVACGRVASRHHLCKNHRSAHEFYSESINQYELAWFDKKHKISIEILLNPKLVRLCWFHEIRAIGLCKCCLWETREERKGQRKTAKRYHLACSVRNDRSQDDIRIKAVRRAERMHQGCVGGVQVDSHRSTGGGRVWHA